MPDTISPEPTNTDTTAAPGKTRRSYSRELKASIVSECLKGERSVASVALEHGINANLVHKWIRHSSSSRPMQPMMPVTAPIVDAAPVDGARMELSVSGVTIRLFGHVESRSIRALLGALQ